MMKKTLNNKLKNIKARNLLSIGKQANLIINIDLDFCSIHLF